jgi:hypothetical protein
MKKTAGRRKKLPPAVFVMLMRMIGVSAKKVNGQKS